MSIVLGKGARISSKATVDCVDLELGAGTVINAGAVVRGRLVRVGREGWIASGAEVGGGGCMSGRSEFYAGDFLHMGKGSHVNIACAATVGDEVGIGRGTSIYTHGAWLSPLKGFPCVFGDVVIGDRVWLPNAQVNPGVIIGSDVVVGAGAVVNDDLPAGCLAGGVPARVIREDVFPRRPTEHDFVNLAIDVSETFKLFADMFERLTTEDVGVWRFFGAVFDLRNTMLTGKATAPACELREQLRRRGVRFRTSVNDRGDFEPWTD